MRLAEEIRREARRLVERTAALYGGRKRRRVQVDDPHNVVVASNVGGPGSAHRATSRQTVMRRSRTSVRPDETTDRA